MTRLIVALDEASIERIAARANELVLGNLLELGLEDLVERIAERLRASGDFSDSVDVPRLVDARELADRLRVSRDTVYEHADELGGKRIGDGPRGRLRFDLEHALETWSSRSTSKESQAPQTPVATGDSPRRRHRRLGSGPELLPIRGHAADLQTDTGVS